MRMSWTARLVAVAAFTAWLLFTGAKVVLVLIGYSTIPDDAKVAGQRVEQLADYVLTTPWWALLPLLAIITIAAVFVAWPVALPRLRKRDSSPMSGIAAQMRSAKSRFKQMAERLEDRFVRVDKRAFDDARHRFRSTEISLQKQGFVVPWLDFDKDPVRYIRTNLDYIEKVEPLISGKHLREAKRQAAALVAEVPEEYQDRVL